MSDLNDSCESQVMQAPINFNNSYILLPEYFYSPQLPTQVSAPKLIQANLELGEILGIDANWLNSEDAVQVFSGNKVAAGSEPIATAYAGHQFGHWNPQLGDGRAILLGEVLSTGKDGAQISRFDIQLKGSGRTAYSRGGDGRSPIGPVLREYLLSEAMYVLGVPTTRALAAVTSGESVWREQALDGAILTRVASSHIRIGTFQYFAAQQDAEGVKQLADHVIARHYPQVQSAENPYVNLLQVIIENVAKLVARWMSIGFIHGVMNTDNMLVSGETIDYGPCAFMDYFKQDKVYSSIDRNGRYAFNHQPSMAQWNLLGLAQSLLPLLHESEEHAVELAQQSVNQFAGVFETEYFSLMANKLGFVGEVSDYVKNLTQELLDLMEQAELDYTLVFRHLTEVANGNDVLDDQSALSFPDGFDLWLTQWQNLRGQGDEIESTKMMNQSNPIFIPRNHLVEEVIQKTTFKSDGSIDLEAFNTLLKLVTNPYQYQDGYKRFTLPPKPEEVVKNTFCGT
jgi:uncharacterized protein YdiU (UPF0061 family)